MTQTAMDMDTRPLPAGWKWVKLEEIASKTKNAIADGPFGSNLKSEHYVETGKPVLKVANVSGDSFHLDGLRFISEEKAIELQRSWVRIGDILIVKIGSTFGRSKIVESLGQYPYAVIPANLAKFTPNIDLVDTDYLHAWLESPYVTNYFLNNVKQTAQPSLSLKIIRPLSVPLPPLEEQKRIAAILNEQMAAVEKAKKAAEGRLAAAKALPAAYLREVFPSEEGELPDSWEQVRLGELIESTTNGLYKPASYYGSGTPMLRMFNIGRLDGTWNLERLDLVEVNEEEYQKFTLQSGDILLNRVNSAELIGKCAVVDASTEGSVFESMNMRLRTNHRGHAKFLVAYLNSIGTRNQITEKLKQIVGQASINQRDVSSLVIPLPPVEQQKDIVSELEDKLAGVKLAEESIHQELETIEAMPTAILRKAFAGEL